MPPCCSCGAAQGLAARVKERRRSEAKRRGRRRRAAGAPVRRPQPSAPSTLDCVLGCPEGCCEGSVHESGACDGLCLHSSVQGPAFVNVILCCTIGIQLAQQRGTSSGAIVCFLLHCRQEWRISLFRRHSLTSPSSTDDLRSTCLPASSSNAVCLAARHQPPHPHHCFFRQCTEAPQQQLPASGSPAAAAPSGGMAAAAAAVVAAATGAARRAAGCCHGLCCRQRPGGLPCGIGSGSRRRCGPRAAAGGAAAAAAGGGAVGGAGLAHRGVTGAGAQAGAVAGQPAHDRAHRDVVVPRDRRQGHALGHRLHPHR